MVHRDKAAWMLRFKELCPNSCTEFGSYAGNVAHPTLPAFAAKANNHEPIHRSEQNDPFCPPAALLGK